MTLPNDIARCAGSGSDADGWREGCALILEDLKPYRIAQQLRSIASRCHDDSAALIVAAEWLEQEAKDLIGLAGSVTHASIAGSMTKGAVIAW